MNQFTEEELKRQQEFHEIQKLIEEITNEAKLVIEDYANNPSEISGSNMKITQVHINSPILKKNVDKKKKK